MDVGKRIKERRKEIGMSVEQLASKLGKSRATLYRYENGDIENLPLDILGPVAKALHTTPAQLMGWDAEIEEDPVGVAEKHLKMITDADFIELYEAYKKLDEAQKKIVTDLVHNLAQTK